MKLLNKAAINHSRFRCKHLEEGICQLAQRYPENIAVKIGYDEALSHLMVAGGDVI